MSTGTHAGKYIVWCLIDSPRNNEYCTDRTETLQQKEYAVFDTLEDAETCATELNCKFRSYELGIQEFIREKNTESIRKRLTDPSYYCELRYFVGKCDVAKFASSCVARGYRFVPF